MCEGGLAVEVKEGVSISETGQPSRRAAMPADTAPCPHPSSSPLSSSFLPFPHLPPVPVRAPSFPPTPVQGPIFPHLYLCQGPIFPHLYPCQGPIPPTPVRAPSPPYPCQGPISPLPLAGPHLPPAPVRAPSFPTYPCQGPVFPHLPLSGPRISPPTPPCQGPVFPHLPLPVRAPSFCARSLSFYLLSF
ncbi:hypothetical protein ACOMHN_024831 [Nucella lapillus]